MFILIALKKLLLQKGDCCGTDHPKTNGEGRKRDIPGLI